MNALPVSFIFEPHHRHGTPRACIMMCCASPLLPVDLCTHALFLAVFRHAPGKLTLQHSAIATFHKRGYFILRSLHVTRIRRKA